MANNTYTLNKVNGNLNGDLLYSVIIFDEGDLAQCQVKLYGANSDDEVADFLYKEGYTDYDFSINLIGNREADITDL